MGVSGRDDKAARSGPSEFGCKGAGARLAASGGGTRKVGAAGSEDCEPAAAAGWAGWGAG